MRGVWDLAFKEVANARVRASAARVLGSMIEETEGLRRTMVLQGQARLGQSWLGPWRAKFENLWMRDWRN